MNHLRFNFTLGQCKNEKNGIAQKVRQTERKQREKVKSLESRNGKEIKKSPDLTNMNVNEEVSLRPKE